MNPQMKKRIEKVEEQIGKNTQRIRVIVWPDDECNHDEKIERWKTGEEVNGVDYGPYQGGELEAMKIGFVNSPLSRANGAKDTICAQVYS